MQSWVAIACLVPAFLLLACGDDESGSVSPDGGGGTGDGGAQWCPDPNESCVHYVDQDPNKCIGVVLDCTSEQNGFQSSCGCGCIDKNVPGCPSCPAPTDPDISWTSHDPAECPPVQSCPLNQTPFSNECGCGCIQPGG